MVDPSLFDDIEKFLETGESPWPSTAPITKEEWFTIVESAFEGLKRPLTEEEAISVLRWAEHIRLSDVLLDLVLKGMINIIPNSDNADDPSFVISEKGKRVVDAGNQIS